MIEVVLNNDEKKGLKVRDLENYLKDNECILVALVPDPLRYKFDVLLVLYDNVNEYMYAESFIFNDYKGRHLKLPSPFSKCIEDGIGDGLRFFVFNNIIDMSLYFSSAKYTELRKSYGYI